MAFTAARLMPAFYMLPFLNSSTLVGIARYPVAMMVGIALWPGELALPSDADAGLLAILLIKEAMLGTVIGGFLCLPIWILHALGSICDNQRGATLSSTMDPLSGVDTSELANFMNLFAAVVILESGGWLHILSVWHQSYILWEPFSMNMPPIEAIYPFLGTLIINAFTLCSPLIIVFLLTELLLGLLSRFAPQLNAFSLALSVKSMVCFVILLLYFTAVYPDKIVGWQRLSELLTGEI